MLKIFVEEAAALASIAMLEKVPAEIPSPA